MKRDARTVNPQRHGCDLNPDLLRLNPTHWTLATKPPGSTVSIKVNLCCTRYLCLTELLVSLNLNVVIGYSKYIKNKCSLDFDVDSCCEQSHGDSNDSGLEECITI